MWPPTWRASSPSRKKNSARTDIADYALERLRNSSVKDIYVLSRRGPAQAKFTNPEIKELGELAIADLLINPKDLELDPASQEAAQNSPAIQRNLSTMQEQALEAPTEKPRRIHLKFLDVARRDPDRRERARFRRRTGAQRTARRRYRLSQRRRYRRIRDAARVHGLALRWLPRSTAWMASPSMNAVA